MPENLALEISHNLEHVQERITRSAILAGRNPNDVKLVVVSKAQPPDVVLAAIEAGVKRLGENYAEESTAKILALGGKLGIEWHMIGHVQSRKAKLVVQHFDMVHSLDSLRLAKKYNALLQDQGKQLPVLIELNLSGEASKSGWQIQGEDGMDTLLQDLDKISDLHHLLVKGLMTMPPLSENPGKTRTYFKQLREVRDTLTQRLPQWNLDELSMGTSIDFEEAIVEGATFVRIGQAILGPRSAR
jgi:pyridoxal phosphate enzyme (YggS family)